MRGDGEEMVALINKCMIQMHRKKFEEIVILVKQSLEIFFGIKM